MIHETEIYGNQREEWLHATLETAHCITKNDIWLVMSWKWEIFLKRDARARESEW